MRGRHLRLLRWLALAPCLACAPLPPEAGARGFGVEVARGLAPQAARQAGPVRGNAEMAGDFLDLEFQLETGQALAGLSRFEGPITVGFAGDVPPFARADLAALTARLRAEAGLAIREAEAGARPQIVIEFVPRARLKRAAPMAACFVVPGVGSFAEYRTRRSSPDLEWAGVRERTQAAIFVPADTSPQEVRDCLHEELAQAIGPLNDLFRLPDSVFNDDNFNTVLTGFDMLMLRLHYAPEIRSGMSRVEAAAVVPGLLRRLNPAGEGLPATIARPATPQAWKDKVEAAFNSGASPASRQAAAERMLALARAEGWRDARYGLSLYAYGRATLARDPQAAARAYAEAAEVYHALPGGAIHAAHADTQLAALALAAGESARAISLCDGALPVIWRAENPALLATLMLIKAEALESLGRVDAARALRLDSLASARYGFGGERQVRAWMADVAALGAQGRAK